MTFPLMALAVGAILAWMRLRSGSLLPGILGHNIAGLTGRLA